MEYGPVSPSQPSSHRSTPKSLILQPIFLQFNLPFTTFFFSRVPHGPMCRYTTAVAVSVDCTRRPQHRLIKVLYQRCRNRPEPGPHCDDAVYDASLGSFIPTERRGSCKVCRDYGVRGVTTVYEHVSSSNQFEAAKVKGA